MTAWRIMAFSPLCWFAPGLFAPWLVCTLTDSPLSLDDSPPIEYTGDSLLRLVCQFTERQQVSVASCHWLIVNSINIIRDKLHNKWSQLTKSIIFSFIAMAQLLYIAYTYRVRQKSGPLKFFAVFSVTVWDFNMKFYSFIYWNLLHPTAK